MRRSLAAEIVLTQAVGKQGWWGTQDMLEAFDAMLPKLEYRHPHDPAHVPDHILASLIGPSLSIPVQHGELALGTWQRVVLCEFDGQRKRTVLIRVLLLAGERDV